MNIYSSGLDVRSWLIMTHVQNGSRLILTYVQRFMENPDIRPTSVTQNRTHINCPAKSPNYVEVIWSIGEEYILHDIVKFYLFYNFLKTHACFHVFSRLKDNNYNSWHNFSVYTCVSARSSTTVTLLTICHTVNKCTLKQPIIIYTRGKLLNITIIRKRKINFQL